MSTIKEVAATAGVSLITVSRVVNDPEKVKPATRKRVQDAMDALNYYPNHVARAIRSKCSRIVDVFIPSSIDLSNPFVMHFIAGISETLSKHMYSFLIRRNYEKEHICDGYIVTGLLKDEIKHMYEYATERNRPLVLFGHTDLFDMDCIDVDNVEGASEIVGRLLDKGCSRLAMINVDENKDYTNDRMAGFQKAFDKRGMSYLDCPILYARNDAQGGYEIAKILLDEYRIDGIFCATDTIALGVTQAISESGLIVPDDISVAGFDGLGHNLLNNIRISTMKQPVFAIGEKIAQVLLERIQGKKERVSILIPPVYVEGDSI